MFSNLSEVDLVDRAVPLPQANTLAQVNFQERRFGRLATEQGSVRFFTLSHLLQFEELDS